MCECARVGVHAHVCVCKFSVCLCQSVCLCSLLAGLHELKIVVSYEAMHG